MSGGCGKSSTLSYSQQSLEQLSQSLSSTLPCTNGFDKIYFPECNTSSPFDDGLYPYQRVARDLLRSSDDLNLLVSSPTGSGKTRVIEECVKLARERQQRIFVAEPLIALVEQIYTRIGGENICMLTGPSRKGSENADVVVCTYEVLARIASCEPHRLDGCPRIVLDEFHFLGTDRGPVIEEILAHCQPGRSVVALSGTMPNVADLAAFLVRINDFPTYVLGAARRPIDISFYAYAAEEDRMSTLAPPQRPQPFRSQSIGGIGNRQSLLRFLTQLDKWDCHPSLLVAFSCRRLDEMADWAASVGSIEREAKRLVAVGFGKMLKGVAPEDRGLFALYRHWADHGVAVHHSHAPTPYLELVSWLAERRALKLVFSSSTLSAGINLPVRTMCLLSARVPKKSPEGGMDHVDIDPLLFHQLVGRAGRPGHETVGNCIIMIKKSSDYSSAQALMTCAVPPVLPLSGFSPGDVLRATRDRRNLLAEIQALACPVEHALSLRADRDERIREAALAHLPDLALVKLLEKQVQAVHEIIKSPPALLPFAMVVSPEPTKHLLLREDGSFSIATTVASSEEAVVRTIQLTTTKRGTKKIPFEDLGAVFSLQEAFKVLLSPVNHDGEALRLIRKICFLNEQARIYLASSPLHEEFERSAKHMEGSCLERVAGGYVLTQIGVAACEIRTCPDPGAVLRRLLACGELDVAQALAFASQSLQEGGGRQETPVCEDGDEFAAQMQEAQVVLDGDLLKEALRGSDGSCREWTLAVLCWAAGAPLERLRQIVPVGTFCRHVTRVSDFCEEISQALKSLGANPSSFEKASDAISHGMPFLKRGVWKTYEIDDVDVTRPEATRVDEHGGIDMTLIFGEDDPC
jgi:DEAD/DEAH box helicase